MSVFLFILLPFRTIKLFLKMQFAISIKVKQHHELPNPILVLASIIKQCWAII